MIRKIGALCFRVGPVCAQCGHECSPDDAWYVRDDGALMCRLCDDGKGRRCDAPNAFISAAIRRAKEPAAADAVAELLRIGDDHAPEGVSPTSPRVVLLLRKCGVDREQLRAWLIANHPVPPSGPPDGWWTEEVVKQANADADVLEAQLSTNSDADIDTDLPAMLRSDVWYARRAAKAKTAAAQPADATPYAPKKPCPECIRFDSGGGATFSSTGRCYLCGEPQARS